MVNIKELFRHGNPQEREKLVYESHAITLKLKNKEIKETNQEKIKVKDSRMV